MTSRFFRSALVATSMVLTAAPLCADTLVASWNVKHLGWDNGKDMRSVARVASAFDLIALQEVMSLEALEILEGELETATGESWESMASDAIGRGSYREHYAFLWRASEVTWVDGAVVYIDQRDAFSREPMSMRFETADNYRFVLASAHLIYGDSVEERQYEATALAEYRSWLEASFEGTPVYISGDFNLPPDNSAWSAMRAASAALITSGATTLSPADGRYANLYDNIWAPAGVPVPVTASGIFDFPAELGVTHEAARGSISDHAPVWMQFDTSTDWTILEAQTSGVPQSSADGAYQFDAQDGGPIRGNRNSKIYHFEGCPGFGRIAARNVVVFESSQSAEAQGYRKAKNCDLGSS